MTPVSSQGGQALIETVAFFMVMSVLMAAYCSFSHYIAVRERILLAAKQGAILFSSGHYRARDVERNLRDFLKSGTPALNDQEISIFIGRRKGAEAWLYEFDDVRVAYRRSSGWHALLNLDPKIEEAFVVKHAPRYWAPMQPWGGPGVTW